MDLLSVVLIAVGLAMDAFAVAICKGMALKRITVRDMLVVGLWFGAFQAIMPIIGYYLGSSFYDYISDYDHWIAFILLAAIGLNMIREAVSSDGEDVDADLGARTMVVLAVATSIDALAVGISLAMSGGGIMGPAVIIGVVTLAISMLGVRIGSVFGDRFGRKAELVGGAILILIGVKVLMEHLGYL